MKRDTNLRVVTLVSLAGQRRLHGTVDPLLQAVLRSLVLEIVHNIYALARGSQAARKIACQSLIDLSGYSVLPIVHHTDVTKVADWLATLYRVEMCFDSSSHYTEDVSVCTQQIWTLSLYLLPASSIADGRTLYPVGCNVRLESIDRHSVTYQRI